MHEVGIVQSALQTALEEARKSGATRIHLLRLRVGALSGVVPDALGFAFEALSQGTMAEGARLEVDPVPATWWCEPCQKEFLSQDYFNQCPDCQQASAQLRRGRELHLASIEVS
jgi:hydrogenase nickel incorporation protein HypA/HybF